MAKATTQTAAATEPTTQTAAATEPIKRQGANGNYYLVNPSGAIHGVNRDHAAERLRVAGWRLASEDEIAAYVGQRIQRADRPIAPRWSPDPDAQIEAVA